MIAKVIRGWRPAGLIAYLMGAGMHEEHRNPRVVAAFDGAPSFHQPPTTGPGEFDFDLRALTGSMQELPKEFRLPLANPSPIPEGQPDAKEWTAWLRTAGKRRPPARAPNWVKYYRYNPKAGAVELKPGYVWHCPVRLHPDDPVLSDEQWERIAQRLMEATGIHQAGCRWIAIRHADDHVHLMATLVTQTGGQLRPFHPHNDWVQLRKTCQELERELGLTPTPDIDRTAGKRPTRSEVGKAHRQSRGETVRTELRRLVAQAAASASGPDEFFTELRDLPVLYRSSLSADGRIRGCSFALGNDRTRDNNIVWFGGGKLAADLTWPALMSRWDSTPAAEPVERTADRRSTPAARRAVLTEAAGVVDAAAAGIRAGEEDPDGIAHAAGEVLGTLAMAREFPTPGPLTAALDRYDRASRSPHRVLPGNPGALARDLRRVSRRLAALGSLSGRGYEKFALAALVLALAGLLAEIRAWQQATGRTHQAAAVGHAIAALPVDRAAAARNTGRAITVAAGRPAAGPDRPAPNSETRRRRTGGGHAAIVQTPAAHRPPQPPVTGGRTR
jgi:hypothetical protein